MLTSIKTIFLDGCHKDGMQDNKNCENKGKKKRLARKLWTVLKKITRTKENENISKNKKQ